MAKNVATEMEWSISPASLGFMSMVRNLWGQRGLIWQLTVREIRQRYRGLYLGTVWSIITPILMLIVYTFVFSVVLKVRWGRPGHPTPPGYFALNLFAALIPFNMFLEVVMASPNLILGVPSFVKRTRFPLEVLSVVKLLSAMIHSFFYQVVLIAFEYILWHHVVWTVFLLPLAYVPHGLLTLGVSWILASLGVYIRDIGPVVEIIVRILFFMTPIFYPPQLVPASFRVVIYMNPLTFIVGCFRRVLIWNMGFRWGLWSLAVFLTLLFAWLAYVIFMKLRKGFAEVL